MTIREHFAAITNDTIRARALANMWWEDQHNHAADLAAALYRGFNWSRSPEGTRYWYAVWNAAANDLALETVLTFEKFAA